MKLEHFGCKVPKGIYQEFEAHIFMMNLVSILGEEAKEEVSAKTKERKFVHKYNWQNAYVYTRGHIMQLFGERNDPQKTIEKMTELFSLSPTAIKSDRKFSRKTKRNKKPRQHQCYK